MFAMLIRIDAQDAMGAAAPLYLASHDLPELCHLGTATWFPALSTLPELAYDFFGGAFTGEIAAPRTGFSVETGDIADFADRRYADARARMWAGDLDGAPAGGTDPIGPLALWFDGRITAEPVVGEDRQAQFTAAVDDAWLDTPLLPLFTGTGGVEGPDDLTGQVKPLALGNLRFAGGQLIDRVENIWMVSHAGFDSGVAAYDRVVALGASQGDFADYAALAAADITAGRWATSKAAGLIKLGAPPDGKVAFDVLGDNAGAGGTVRRAGAMIARIAQLAGGSVNAASLTALNAARPYNLALQLAAQVTPRAVIQQIADSVAAVAGVSWTGELFVQSVGLGAAQATLAEDGTSDMAVIALEEREKAAPFWRIATEAEPTWVLFDQGEVALDFTWRGPWNALRVYRIDDLVTAPDGRSFVYINAVPSAGNALPGTGVTSNAHWDEFSAAQANRATTFFTAPPATAPTLALDFLRSKILDPRLTYTRASTATYWGSDGRLKTAAANEPRFTHNPATGEPLGLLQEPAATNLLVRSEELDDAGTWAANRCSVTPNAIAGPTGALTMDKIVEDTTAANSHLIIEFMSKAATALPYTLQCVLKAGERTKAAIRMLDDLGAGTQSGVIDLAAGTIGNPTANGGTAIGNTIWPLGGGMFLVTLSAISTARTGWRADVILLDAGGNENYNGDGASGLYATNVQMEQTAYPTSYIPTTAAQVARAADKNLLSGTNFSSWYDAVKGTVFLDIDVAFQAGGAGTPFVLGISDAVAAANRANISIFEADNSVRAEVIRSTTIQAALVGPAGTAGRFNGRAALSYAENDFALTVDGAVVSTDVGGTVAPSVAAAQMEIGARGDTPGGDGSSRPMLIRDVRFYPARLTNAELQAITAQPVAEAVGDVWKDGSAGNRETIWNGEKWALSRDGSITDALSGAVNKLGPIEDNADVTKVVKELPPEIVIQYNFDGTAKDGQLPRVISVKLFTSGGVQITSGITWSVETVSGTISRSISGTGTGSLSITSLTSQEAVITVKALVNGQSYFASARVSKLTDPPPPPAGGAGPQSAPVTGTVSSGTYVTVGTMAVIAEAGGTIQLRAPNLTVTPQSIEDATATDAKSKWQWESSPSTWTDIGSVTFSNPDATEVEDTEIPGLWSPVDGLISADPFDHTGRTNGVSYNYRLQMAINTGPVRNVFPTGTMTGTPT